MPEHLDNLGAEQGVGRRKGGDKALPHDLLVLLVDQISRHLLHVDAVTKRFVLLPRPPA